MRYKLDKSSHAVFSLQYPFSAGYQVSTESSLKGVTARLMRKEFPQLKERLWGGSFWSNSYFLASTGQVNLDVLKKYVEEQQSA